MLGWALSSRCGELRLWHAWSVTRWLIFFVGTNCEPGIIMWKLTDWLEARIQLLMQRQKPCRGRNHQYATHFRPYSFVFILQQWGRIIIQSMQSFLWMCKSIHCNSDICTLPLFIHLVLFLEEIYDVTKFSWMLTSYCTKCISLNMLSKGICLCDAPRQFLTEVNLHVIMFERVEDEKMNHSIEATKNTARFASTASHLCIQVLWKCHSFVLHFEQTNRLSPPRTGPKDTGLCLPD